MSSRKTEDTHVIVIKRILSQSGIECARTTTESVETESELEEEEQLPTIEEVENAPELIQEETQLQQLEEEVTEEQPDVFPTPSLRKVLPDKVRRIEEMNRIHVLPERFKTNIDPAAIPKIASTPQQKYIDILADLVGCTMYKSSLAEFWFLDTLANMLRRAQDDALDRPTQAVLILWFCEWMKEIQHFDAADRSRMLRRFKDNMLSAAYFIAEEDYIPTPDEAGVYYKSQEEVLIESTSQQTEKHAVTFEGAAYECSLRNLTLIIHYIYDLFATDYQYDLVRSIFTFSPEYTLIDAPHQIQMPKRLYAPLKPKTKEKSPKKEAKPTGKGKKKDVETEEFLALMELKAKEEREIEEKEELEREEWNLKSHILPLNFAADDSFFDKYWPPPPPEPQPEPELQTAKGKGKKK